MVPKNSILNFTCKSNYILKGNTISVCADNEWYQPPSCHSKSISTVYLQKHQTTLMSLLETTFFLFNDASYDIKFIVYLLR